MHPVPSEQSAHLRHGKRCPLPFSRGSSPSAHAGTSRHSLQTQPCTYAALVPCWRSSRRVAVRAASSALDHSSSALVRPNTWFEVRPRSRSTVRNGRPLQIASRSCCRVPRRDNRACARALHAPWRRHSALAGTGRSRSPQSTGSMCRGRSGVHGGDPADRSGRGSVQLLESPRRRRYQPEREPPPYDRRRHVAHGSGLANGGDQLFGLIHRTHASEDLPLPRWCPHNPLKPTCRTRTRPTSVW